MKKKLIALLIVVLMVITMVPMTVFAAGASYSYKSNGYDGRIVISSDNPTMGLIEPGSSYQNFDDNGGSSSDTWTFTAVANPGYEFDRWEVPNPQYVNAINKNTNILSITYKKNNGTGEEAGSVFTAKALFKTIGHMVTYDANGATGGSVPTDNNSYSSGATVSVCGNTGGLEKSGYVFDGWEDASGTSYSVASTFTMGDANVKLYAKWVKLYEVSFQTRGGSPAPAKQDIPEGGKVTKPADPAKTGFAFTGWYYNGALWDFDNNTVTQNITLCADWTELNKVTFDSKGGSPVSPQYIPDGGKVTKPADPTKNGNAFGGWYYYQNHQQKDWDFDANEVNDDITLRARWIEQHTVAFNSMGGSQVDSQTVLDGGKATRPTDPTKNGYAFDGWYYIHCGQQKDWDFNTNTVTDNITLCARWIEQHTVTFNSMGGSQVGSQTVLDGGKAIKPADPTKTGYVFDGWYYYHTQWNFDTSTVSHDIVLYAKWIEQHTVTFDSRGGSSVDSQTVLDGENATKPDDPSKEGYVFDCWLYKKGHNEFREWNFEQHTVTKNMTLYASWIEVHPVVFDTQGGSSVDSQTVLDGGKVIKPADPTKTGYTFSGWYYNHCGQQKEWNFGFYKVYGNLTLIAKWTANDYIVTYDKNGGDGGITADSSHTYGIESNLTTNGYYKAGHDFAGWAKREDASAAEYADGVGVLNLTDENGGSVSLYAVWDIIQFDVTFYEQDGTTVISQQKINWNAAAQMVDAPGITGYAFDKWILKGYDDTESTSLVHVKEKIDAVASYIKNGYTVTFLDYNGTVLGTDGVLYGEAATAPEEMPAREGYTFVGWDKEFNKVTGNLTVTAQYEINTYTVKFVDFDGRELKSQSVNWNASATAPANPAFTGYTFTGWDKAFDKVTSDLTVKAQYAINKYTVKFVDFDGKELSIQTVNWNTAATAPTSPTFTGYTFTGWDKAFDKVTSDLTVTAQYAINKYTVKFVDYDGKELSVQSVNWSTAATAPTNPTRPGYTFTSWDKSFSSITSDLTVTAQYKQNASIDDEDVPKTYDDSQAFPWWWIVAAAGLIGAIVWIIVFQIKKRKHTGDMV